MFAVEFQSTHPRRVRLDTLHVTGQFAVSIHAPTQGATLRTNSRLCTGMFQSTHPRRVRRRSASLSDCSCVVSIHAPTQGATEQIQDEVRLFLFQSTHPRRVRLNSKRRRCSRSRFNPRTHAGCDLTAACVCVLLGFQSTHPRRVRRIAGRKSWQLTTFQSTHPRRVRRASTVMVASPVMFQSTHPRRVRLSHIHNIRCWYSFNPRTHAGCDFK